MTNEEQMWEWLIKVGQVPEGSKPPSQAAPIADKDAK